jgi:uncharacterized protein YkwD
MKIKGCLTLALLLTIILLHGQSPNDTIDPDHFNYKLAQDIFLEKFNAFRVSIKTPVMEPDPILQKAAQSQAGYCMKKNLVTHYQPEYDKMYEPKDRVRFYHGNHGLVGENCLYNFIRVAAMDTHAHQMTTIYTYDQLANGILEQWKNSPPHYANMIHKEYTRTGIALSMHEDKKTIYATQVFASAPYTPPYNGLKYSDTTWGVKENVPGKCRSLGEYDFLAEILSSYLLLYNDSIFQYYQDESVIKKLLQGPKDGLAADLVFKNQFFCDKPNNLHPSTVFDGYMLPPKYRDEIFKSDKYKNEELLSYLGSVPRGAPLMNMQINLALVQNSEICRYSYPVVIDRDMLKDLPVYPQWCKVDGSIKKGVADFDREFYIPFERNATHQDSFYFQRLKDLLVVFDGTISSVEIDAYSSVEGTEASNLALQNARANFIEGFIKKNITQKVAIKKNALENWDKMYAQIRDAGFKHFFSDTSHATMRAEINKRIDEPILSDWLNKQRIATVKLHLHKEYNDTTEARFMPMVLYDKIYNNDSTQAIIAYSRTISAYQEGNLDKRYLSAIEVPLRSSLLPLVNNYLASIIVQSDIFNYSSYSASYFDYIDSAVKKFSAFKPLKFNVLVYQTHLYFHNHLKDVNGFQKMSADVDSLCRDTTIDKKLRHQLEFNYYLTGSTFYFQHRMFKDMYRSFEKVKALLPLANLKASEAYDVGLYFNYFMRCHETMKLLETYLQKYPEDEDLIYLYVSTGALINLNTGQKLDLYYKELEKLAIKNKPRLCRWFNTNYQLLRQPEFKKRICANCHLD